MEKLSVAYQAKRPELEKGDITSLTLKALCQCANSANSANRVDSPFVKFFTSGLPAADRPRRLQPASRLVNSFTNELDALPL